MSAATDAPQRVPPRDTVAPQDTVPPPEIVSLQRLRAVSRAMLGPMEPPETAGAAPAEAPAAEFADLLDRMVGSLLADPAPRRVWLLMVALSGRFPSDDELQLAIRTLALTDRVSAMVWLLEDSLDAAGRTATAGWTLQLVERGVVVDVEYSATHDLHTGIQRVVRTTLPRWSAAHDVVPVAWTHGHHAMRGLSPGELDRVHRWGGTGSRPATGADEASAGDGAHTLIVPWDSTVVLLEVPTREACERLASVGQWSGNRVVAVGYDCIPIVSAGLVPLAEPSRFVHYLTAVKYMSAVAGISISATSEFRGFAQMLPAQGLVGPRVTECALPVDATGVRPREAAGSTTEPLVLCVGSREPRKNQLAVLWAAEVLWREGLNFRLRFVGAGGWGNEFPRAVRRARRAGRPVEVLTAISEDELDESYRTARFTVFVSLHEGYGLPVAESLARSTPALASNYGSIREIGVGGGTLLVDPRDDEQIVDGMRRMLVDDALIRELSAQIARRPQRTWDDYAAELWEVLGLADAGAGPAAGTSGA